MFFGLVSEMVLPLAVLAGAILILAVLLVNAYLMTRYAIANHNHMRLDTLPDGLTSTVDSLNHLAEEIQSLSLPSVFPPYPDRKDFDIYALMNTAKVVGGDFYDFCILGNDQLLFLIADVSGKGIPATLFMMKAKSVIKGLAESGLAADEIFTQANAKLYECNDKGTFVTAWAGILDLQTGKLQYSSAGHNPPLIRHANGTFDYLSTKSNFVLAGLEDSKYTRNEFQMAPGDEIFLYTDGLIKARNASNQMFGKQQLVRILNDNPNEGVKRRCSRLSRAVKDFVGRTELADDITLLSVKLNYLQTYDRIVVYPDLDSTEAVWKFIDYKSKKYEISKKTINKIKICTDEIYSNIIRYSTASFADIFCKVDKNGMMLIFCDNGIPFDPTLVAEPDRNSQPDPEKTGGIGICMVKQSATLIEYQYKDFQNRLTLFFNYQ